MAVDQAYRFVGSEEAMGPNLFERIYLKHVRGRVTKRVT